MIGTLIGILKIAGLVLAILFVVALAFIMIIVLASIISTSLQMCFDFVPRRKK